MPRSPSSSSAAAARALRGPGTVHHPQLTGGHQAGLLALRVVETQGGVVDDAPQQIRDQRRLRLLERDAPNLDLEPDVIAEHPLHPLDRALVELQPRRDLPEDAE